MYIDTTTTTTTNDDTTTTTTTTTANHNNVNNEDVQRFLGTVLLKTSSTASKDSATSLRTSSKLKG